MILNKKEWHYLAVNKLSVLLRRIAKKNDGAFYYLNCLHPFKANLPLIKNYVK